MPLYDESEALDFSQSLAPATYTASANGSSVSLAGYESATVVFSAGSITDGTHTPSLEFSDDYGSTWTAISNSDLVGSLSALSSNEVQAAGWIGFATNLRAVTTVAGATSGGVYGASIVLGNKGAQ